MKYLRPACLALAFVATAVAVERADFAHARRTHHHLSHHLTARTWTRSAVAPVPVVGERAADPQQQSQHDETLQTPSCQMGKEEQSSHAPSADPPANAVFVNGALAVPGAPANTDTVPAKFSAKNAADDELITIAYTFKTLTDDERRAVYQALKDQPAGSAFNADIGTKLPPGIELRPVPEEVAARVPQTRDYRYAVAMDRVLLVGTNRIVVGVFADEPVSEGRRDHEPSATLSTIVSLASPAVSAPDERQNSSLPSNSVQAAPNDAITTAAAAPATTATRELPRQPVAASKKPQKTARSQNRPDRGGYDAYAWRRPHATSSMPIPKPSGFWLSRSK
jgi:hypothetical protein